MKTFTTAISLLLFWAVAESAESKKKTATGLTRIQLVTDANHVVPGEDITVALVLKPDTDFHIYWRGPGIVGVAPVIEWGLPEGFEAAPIEWPAPEKVDMVGITANGFHDETWLLSKIRVPDKITAKTIELRAKVAWMACAMSCHPGIEHLSLELPIGKSADADQAISEKFSEIRSHLPPPAPEDWKFALSSESDQIHLQVTIPGLKWSDDTAIDFFCDDLQVDSDIETIVTPHDESSFTLTFTRPDFAPKSHKSFSGVLFSQTGWPGIESKWVEIAVPWHEPNPPNE